MAAPVLQFKRGLASNVGLASFRAGEPGFTTDKYDFYIGLDATATNQKFFGSARYWKREDATNAAQVKLVDKDGTNFIGIAASNTLSGIATYRLPNTTNGSTGDFLKLKSAASGYYDLEWAAVPSGSFTIAGDTGTDTFTTGETLTFAGTASEIETAVTNNQVQIGLPNNVVVGGALTVTTGAVIDGVQIGISGANVIDTVSGNLTLNSAGGQTIIDDLVTIQNNLNVTGNVTIGGTSIFITGQEVLIKNRDIILGYTTSISNVEISNDDTANHGGVAIASTIGSPLVSFSASGINTLPDTYKQMMWFKSGTLGFSTDTFAFNYGVAIGTTTMANGIRFAVGSGITATDNSITATSFVGSLIGNVTGNINSSGISTFATVSAANINASGIVTASSGFVGNLTGNVTGTASTASFATTSFGLSGTPNITVGAVNASSINVSGLSTFVGNAVFQGNASFGDQDEIRVGASDDLKIVHTASGAPFDRNRIISSVTSSNLIGLAIESAGGAIAFTKGDFTAGGEIIAKFIPDGEVELYHDNSIKFETTGYGATVFGTLQSQQLNVTGITTTGTLVLSGTPGIAITAISSSTSLAENSNSYLPTQAAVKAYIDAIDVDDDLGIAGDSGTGTINLDSQSLTVAGTAGEIETSASGQTITVGLPNTVIVGTALSAPTLLTATLQHRNGTQAATIDTSGNITASQNLTVSGNLYVNGSTTQVNTASMTVEDRTIELGVVDGSAPSSTTTWDLGVLFNYYDGAAKKSALIWEQGDARFKLGSVVSDGGGTGNSDPQITFTTYAPLEIGGLWVNDCAGQSQVINCSGSTRTLENITIDAGSF